MSQENLQAFLAEISQDKEATANLQYLADQGVPAIIAYAAERGYEFSEQDLEVWGNSPREEIEELSTNDLMQVAGGVRNQVGGMIGDRPKSLEEHFRNFLKELEQPLPGTTPNHRYLPGVPPLFPR